MGEGKKNSNPQNLSDEIRKLLLNALNRKGWYFFKNSQLIECWEEMKCDNSHCPSYQADNLRCWQVSGTFCSGVPQGEFALKLGDCQKCRVYMKATQGDPILQIGEDFNNLMFHLKKKEDELRLSMQITEEKNKELAALNRKIRRLLQNLDNKNVLLNELSIKDGLTGLYNYRYFTRILREQYNLSRRYNSPLSFIMIDIDYFKAVNDTYGHQAGDRVLIQLADILVKNVRDTDMLVRYGGEEFAIILPYTDQDDAFIKAEKLRIMVSDHLFNVRGKPINIAISLGIASYPANGKINKPEGLAYCADKALYTAKESGRNQTVVYAEQSGTKKKNKPDNERALVERRKYPRIQTMVNVKGRLNSRNLSFTNAYDMSCSGLSLISGEPIESNKILSMNLCFPGNGNGSTSSSLIDLEGLVVRCEEINGKSVKHPGNSRDVSRYLVGVQFSSISKKDRVRLQKYFVSLFKE